MRALIRVDQFLLLLFAAPYRHALRLQYNIGRMTALHRPTHHAAGVHIDCDSQVGKFFQGAVLVEVCRLVD